jgi:predicted Zn-dependent peptidase
MAGMVSTLRVTVRNALGVLTARQTACAGAASSVSRSTIAIGSVYEEDLPQGFRHALPAMIFWINVDAAAAFTLY